MNLLSDVRTDARYMVSPQLTSTDYPDVDVNRNINLWYKTVIGWIVAVQGEWEFNGDILVADLKAGVTQYTVPTNLLRLYRAEVCYTVGGNFVETIPLSVQAKTGEAEGNATRYSDDVTFPTLEVFGDTLELKPAPTVDVAGGFKIWAQLDLTDLDDAVNNVPDLMDPVRRILSIGAAIDYCTANEMYKKRDELKKDIFGDPTKKNDDGGLKDVLETLYANRAGTRRDRLVARRGRFN